MIKINPNISVVISTTQNVHNEWMAFATWYSINRIFPEIQVAAIFPRSKNSHQFLWMNKCKVPYLNYGWGISEERAVESLVSHGIIKSKVFILPDYLMIFRRFDIESLFNKDIVPSDKIPKIIGGFRLDEIVRHDKIKTEVDNPTVIDFRECGKFSLNSWIEKEKRHPFFRTGQLISKNRTVNEQRVFSMWRQMATTFDFINRPDHQLAT